MVILTFANKGNNFIISSNITVCTNFMERLCEAERYNIDFLKNNDIKLHQGCINIIKSHKFLIFSEIVKQKFD